MNQPPLILFDGICNFCSAGVLLLIRLDKKSKFRFASLQSEPAKFLLLKMGMTVDKTETILYIKNEQLYDQSTAVLEILKDLGGIGKAAFVFQLIPKKIRDAVYRFIANRRYRLFGKRSSCLMPSPGLEKRFLS